MMENIIMQQKRRLDILEGISQDLKHSEISAQLGATQGIIKSDIKYMRRKGDLGLIQAEKDQVQVREKKALLLSKEKQHSKQNERFLGMTGITIQEKSFHNMIDFYKHELLKILKSTDQNAAISKLPKSVRKTLLNYGIITNVWRNGEITVKALDYLFG
jgi:hypothetical protein